MAENTNPQRVVTGKVRLSYCNIWQPKSINGGEPKYSASILIPKTDTATIEKVKTAIETAIKDGTSTKWNGKEPPRSTMKLPLRDGDIDRPDDEAYANCFFVNANSKTPPTVKSTERDENGKLKVLTAENDSSSVYSGVYARASLSFYPFNTNGNKGVAVGLENIQKLQDGEPLGGKVSADVDFADDLEDYLD